MEVILVNKIVVKVVNYYLINEYVNGMFNSCKDV